MNIDYIVQVSLPDPHNRKVAIEGRTISTHLAAMMSFVRVTAGPAVRTLPWHLSEGTWEEFEGNCVRGREECGWDR